MEAEYYLINFKPNLSKTEAKYLRKHGISIARIKYHILLVHFPFGIGLFLLDQSVYLYISF